MQNLVSKYKRAHTVSEKLESPSSLFFHKFWFLKKFKEKICGRDLKITLEFKFQNLFGCFFISRLQFRKYLRWMFARKIIEFFDHFSQKKRPIFLCLTCWIFLLPVISSLFGCLEFLMAPLFGKMPVVRFVYTTRRQNSSFFFKKNLKISKSCVEKLGIFDWETKILSNVFSTCR